MYKDDFKKQSKALTDMAGKVADTTESKSAERISQRGVDEDKKKKACKLAYMILDESLDMFKSGEMTLEEAIEDFRKAAKAIDMEDLPEGKEKDEEVLEVVLEGDKGGGDEY